MNAVSLYVTTCRMVFQSCSDDSGAWADIYRLLSYLRQALTCCVCEKLLMIPFSSPVSSCQHCVCKLCVGGKRRLKSSCDGCADYDKFAENVKIRIVLQCYKRLCEYLNDSVQHRKWANLNGGMKVNFGDIVQEGASFSDEFQYSELGSSSCLRGEQSFLSPPTDGETSVEQPSPIRSVLNGDSERTITNGNSSVYTSVTVAGSNSTKLMIKRTTTENTGSDLQDLKTCEGQPKRARFGDVNSVSTSKNTKLKRKGCRCGLATPNPGKLTCCGQRCPCYVDSKACQDCRCRGCRNPHSLTLNNQLSHTSQLPAKIKVEIVTDVDSETMPLDTTSDIN